MLINRLTNIQTYLYDVQPITLAVEIENEVHRQTLKIHCSHLSYKNDFVQKQLLFDVRSSEKTWNQVERIIRKDKRQVKREMMGTNNFVRLLRQVL